MQITQNHTTVTECLNNCEVEIVQKILLGAVLVYLFAQYISVGGSVIELYALKTPQVSIRKLVLVGLFWPVTLIKWWFSDNI